MNASWFLVLLGKNYLAHEGMFRSHLAGATGRHSERPSGPVEGHGREQEFIRRVFLDREDRGLHLVEVGEGFQNVAVHIVAKHVERNGVVAQIGIGIEQLQGVEDSPAGLTAFWL